MRYTIIGYSMFGMVADQEIQCERQALREYVEAMCNTYPNRVLVLDNATGQGWEILDSREIPAVMTEALR